MRCPFAIRFRGERVKIITTPLAIGVVVSLLSAGCAARNGVSMATVSTPVPATQALVLPAPGTHSIVKVVERRYSNALEQLVALSTTAATPGQNFIGVQAFGSMDTAGRDAGSLAYEPVQHRTIRREIGTYYPGHRLSISTNFVRNSYGPFGYAYGPGAGRDGCLYGWQQIRSSEADRSFLQNQGLIQIRLRICEVGASEQDLVRLMYGYTIVGGFRGKAWNPYGSPEPVDSSFGGNTPLVVAEEKPRREEVTTRRRAGTSSEPSRDVARDDASSHGREVILREDAILVPSPTGTRTSDEKVSVPTPSCVAKVGTTTTCN